MQKWLSEESLPIAEKRREAKGKGEAEAEDTKERWQEYPEELYKKDLHDPDNHNGVITHLQPDILECEVKWAFNQLSSAAQSCLTLCNPMNRSTAGLPVHR